MATANRHVAGLAQLFRVKPVLSWGVSALLLGLALSVQQSGLSLNYVDGLIAAVGVLVAQGFASHGINDVVDWLTGTDKESIGKGTGGSRVIPEGKLSVVETAFVGVVAIAAVAAIGLYFVSLYGFPMLVLLAVALWAPVGYSAPPFKMGYRPFSELTIVVPALTGVVVGIVMVLTGEFTVLSVAVGLMHALFCVHWFIISRLPDYDPDKDAGKVTTVVKLGREKASELAIIYLAAGMMVAAYLAFEYSLLFLTAFPYTMACIRRIERLDPFDPHDASDARLYNMRLTTWHAVVLSALLAVVA